jgi:ABC-type transporter Mla subunit MlaD
MTRLQTTLDEAQQVVSQIRHQIPAVVQRYDSTLTRIDQAFTEVKDILGDTKTDIRSMLSNLNHTTATFKSRLPTTFDKADNFLTRTTETIDNARGTLGDIRAAADHLKNATAEARSILVRNRSKIDNMITSLRNTSTQLESASTEIRRSPWRLLYQPQINELSNLNLFDATREFAQAATRLDDAASAVRDASQDPTLSTQRLQELLQTLDESFQKYKDIEAKLWDEIR